MQCVKPSASQANPIQSNQSDRCICTHLHTYTYGTLSVHPSIHPSSHESVHQSQAACSGADQQADELDHEKQIGGGV